MPNTSTLTRKLADRRPHVVTFTKRDGTLRQMRCQYEGGPIRHGVMQVFDLDKQAVRSITLANVHTVWNITPKETKALTAIESMTMQEIADLF